MDMLKTFFEIGTDSSLFDGLEISKETDIYAQYMGKYPVISVSLKDVDGMDFQTASGMLGIAVSEEAERFGFLLESNKLTPSEKMKLTRLMDGDFQNPVYLHNSLRLLTKLLFKHYEAPVIVLIDEYDGYHFGNTNVYCQWDVINQCDKLRAWPEAPMEAHWENSSSNAIVQDLLEDATETTKSQIEALISGEAVEKVLIPELTYTDLENDDPVIRQTYLWSVLFAAGYLTDAGRPGNEIHKLVIPNREVMNIYEKRIRSWFKVRVTGDTVRWTKFCEAIKTGDAVEVQQLFNEFMAASISIRDTFSRKEWKEIMNPRIEKGMQEDRQKRGTLYSQEVSYGLAFPFFPQGIPSWPYSRFTGDALVYIPCKIPEISRRPGCAV